MRHGHPFGILTVLSATLLLSGCHGWQPVSPEHWAELADWKAPPPVRISTPTQTIEIQEPILVRTPPGASAGQPGWQWRSPYSPDPAPFPLLLVSGVPASRAYLGGGVFRAEPGILVNLVPGRDQVKILTLRPGPTIAGVFATIGLVGLMALTSGTLVYLMNFSGQG